MSVGSEFSSWCAIQQLTTPLKTAKDHFRIVSRLKKPKGILCRVWDALHLGEVFPLRDDPRAAMRSLLLCAAVLFDQERILSIRLTTSIRIGSGMALRGGVRQAGPNLTGMCQKTR
jgi:hypothetical protein